MKHAEEQKRTLVHEYCEGTTVKSLICKYNVSRSTVYEWVKLYKAQTDKKTKEVFSYRQLLDVKNKLQNAELELQILKEAQ